MAAGLGNELLPILQRTFTEHKSTDVCVAVGVDVDFRLVISASKDLSRNHEGRLVPPRRTDHTEFSLHSLFLYLRERLAAFPGLTAMRLWRELRERGYAGGYTAVKRAVRDIRPEPAIPFEVRFETPPGEQAQVVLARFEVEFTDEPGVMRIVWLFSMVLGYSRWLWARFVIHQDLQSVLRCHIAALEAIGGGPRDILYDRMKTAVIGEDPDGLVIYNRALLDLARHYGFQPRACHIVPRQRERSSGRSATFARTSSLAPHSAILTISISTFASWLDTVANRRLHATTQRVVNEAFAEEKPALKPLPLVPYRTVLKLERRLSHEGMVSVSGNLYSVPDTTRRRVLDVHVFADEIRIFEDGVLIATHAPLEGRDQRRLDPTHRKGLPPRHRRRADSERVIRRTGDQVARRPLDFYDAVARRLAGQGGPR